MEAAVDDGDQLPRRKRKLRPGDELVILTALTVAVAMILPLMTAPATPPRAYVKDVMVIAIAATVSGELLSPGAQIPALDEVNFVCEFTNFSGSEIHFYETIPDVSVTTVLIVHYGDVTRFSQGGENAFVAFLHDGEKVAVRAALFKGTILYWVEAGPFPLAYGQAGSTNGSGSLSAGYTVQGSTNAFAPRHLDGTIYVNETHVVSIHKGVPWYLYKGQTCM